MKELSNFQCLLRIESLCHDSKVPFVLDLDSLTESQFRKFLVIAYIGDSAFYYSPSAFLAIRHCPNDYKYLDSVVVKSMLV